MEGSRKLFWAFALAPILTFVSYKYQLSESLLANATIGGGTAFGARYLPIRLRAAIDIPGMALGRFIELGVGVVSNPKRSLEKILTGIGFPSRKRKQ